MMRCACIAAGAASFGLLSAIFFPTDTFQVFLAAIFGGCLANLLVLLDQ
jgi:ABC-type enterobactin transport system permease subunit